MTMRHLLRQGWENLVGLVFAVAGLLVLLLLFWVNYLVTGLRSVNMQQVPPSAGQAPILQPDEISDQQPTTSSPADQTSPDALHLLPNEGIYIVDGQSLDATINEIVRREQERIAAEKAAAEAKRRAEEARRRKIAEQKRRAEEAKRRAAEKKKAEARRKAEERRKAEQARKKAEQQKAAEAKRKAAEKQKAAAEAAQRKAAEDKKHKAAEQKKADAARRKAEAKKKAAQEAKRKAKEARELDAKLAALGVGNVPSLDGGLQSAGSAYDQGDIDGYSALLDTAVSRYYRLPDNIPSNLEAEFIIRINAAGKVVDVVLQRSSGYPLFDSEARNAIFAASPLPLPTNSALREDTIAQGIKFTFNP